MVDVSKIIDRLKELKGLNSDAELARFLGGYERAAPGGWRKRNSLPWEELFAKCRHDDLNFILFGERRDESEDSLTYGALRDELAESRGKILQEMKIQSAAVTRLIRKLHESVHGPLSAELIRSLTGEDQS
jgi:hypothetical protein